MNLNFPGLPVKGLAITLATLYSSAKVICLILSQYWYSLGIGTTSSCAATCKVESLDVYTIRLPYDRCLSPNSFIISSPFTTLFPITLLPVTCSILWSNSIGNAFSLKVLHGCVLLIPTIS